MKNYFTEIFPLIFISALYCLQDVLITKLLNNVLQVINTVFSEDCGMDLLHL